MAEFVEGLTHRQNDEHQGVKRFLIAMMVLCVSALFYTIVIRQWVSGYVVLPELPGGTTGATLAFLILSVVHSIYALGWRLGLIFFAISIVVSWVFEQIGVTGGWLFGRYPAKVGWALLAGVARPLAFV